MKTYTFLTMMLFSFASQAQLTLQAPQTNPLILSEVNVATGVSNLVLNLKNTGSAVASLPSTITGTGASEFKISLNRCTNIAPNKTCQVTLSSQRTISVGSKSLQIGDIQIQMTVVKKDAQGNDISSPPQVESLSFEPNVLEDIQFVQNEKSKSVTVSVVNSGNVAVVPSVAWLSNVANLKMAVNRCTSSLAPGKTCSVVLQISAVSSNVSQTLQASVGAQLKDSLVINVKPFVIPTTQDLTITFAEQTKFKLYSGSGTSGENPLFEGTQSGLRVFSLSPGSYTLLMDASVGNPSSRKFLFEPASCSLVVDDSRIGGKSGYECSINLSAPTSISYESVVRPGFAVLLDHPTEDLSSELTALRLRYSDEINGEQVLDFSLQSVSSNKLLAVLDVNSLDVAGSGIIEFESSISRLTVSNSPLALTKSGPYSGSSLKVSFTRLEDVSNLVVLKLVEPENRKADLQFTFHTPVALGNQVMIDMNFMTPGQDVPYDDPMTFLNTNPHNVFSQNFLDLGVGAYEVQGVAQIMMNQFQLNRLFYAQVQCSAPSINFSLSSDIFPQVIQYGPQMMIAIWQDSLIDIENDQRRVEFAMQESINSMGGPNVNAAASMIFRLFGMETFPQSFNNDLSCSVTMIQYQ